MKNIAKFVSPDGNETLTIVAAQGKRGINVKASVKSGSGKGAPKAQTGCRAKFDKVDEAVSAFEKLCAESLKRGWTRKAISAKNVFSAIPAPSALPAKKGKAA